MKTMTLGRKIAIGFGTLIAFAAILGAVAVLSMKSVERAAITLATEYVPETDIASNLESAIWELQLEVRSYGFTGEEKYLTAARTALKDVHSHLDQAQKLSDAHPDLVKLRGDLAALKPALAAYEKAIEETVVKNKEILAGRESLNKAAADFITNIDVLIATQVERLDKEIASFTEVEKLKERRLKLTLLTEIRGEGNAARIAVFKSQALRDPVIIEQGLTVFTTMEKKFAEVHSMLKVPADIEELDRVKKDAILYRDTMKEMMADNIALAAIGKSRAEVAATLLKLTDETSTDGMKRTVSAADESSQKLSSSSTIVVAGLVLAVLLGIAVAFFIIRGTTKVLTNVSTSLREAADQVSAAAGQVSSSSQALAEGASEQASSLEETSASLEEINSMAKRSSENAQNAKGLAEETRQVAEQGSKQMEEMLGAMNAIKQSSDNISKIIKTIDEIAFQTNILALNAAVEAARAGEAGMGFAVVADEVRSLAQRAAQAAKETAGMIDESMARSSNGVGISARVAETLNQITDKARRVNSLVAEIATASNEQSSGVEQVNSAVSQMDKVTQSNAAGAEETASAAEELTAQAMSLQQTVADLMALVGQHANGSGRTVAPDSEPVHVARRSRAAVAHSNNGHFEHSSDPAPHNRLAKLIGPNGHHN